MLSRSQRKSFLKPLQYNELYNRQAHLWEERTWRPTTAISACFEKKSLPSCQTQSRSRTEQRLLTLRTTEIPMQTSPSMSRAKRMYEMEGEKQTRAGQAQPSPSLRSPSATTAATSSVMPSVIAAQVLCVPLTPPRHSSTSTRHGLVAYTHHTINEHTK
jgi:hypothetical protein